MYPTFCPKCGRGFRDVKNRLYIASEGRCYICALDEIRDMEIERWEDEGGHFQLYNEPC